MRPLPSFFHYQLAETKGNWSLSNPNFPTKKPSPDDIVGVWVPNQVSLERMTEEGNYKISTHTLEFKNDGSFEMINMPDWWIKPYGESGSTFHSGKGTWDIFKQQSNWVIRVKFDTLTGRPRGLGTSFYLFGKKPPFLIGIYLGDPDSSRIFYFERK